MASGRSPRLCRELPAWGGCELKCVFFDLAMFENHQDPKYAERCFERDFKSSSRSLAGLTLCNLISLFHFLSACMLFKMRVGEINLGHCNCDEWPCGNWAVESTYSPLRYVVAMPKLEQAAECHEATLCTCIFARLVFFFILNRGF